MHKRNEKSQIRSVEAALVRRFHGRLPRSIVLSEVESTRQSLGDPRIQAYVPVLIQKEASARLQKVAQLRATSLGNTRRIERDQDVAEPPVVDMTGRGQPTTVVQRSHEPTAEEPETKRRKLLARHLMRRQPGQWIGPSPGSHRPFLADTRGEFELTAGTIETP